MARAITVQKDDQRSIHDKNIDDSFAKSKRFQSQRRYKPTPNICAEDVDCKIVKERACSVRLPPTY